MGLEFRTVAQSLRARNVCVRRLNGGRIGVNVSGRCRALEYVTDDIDDAYIKGLRMATRQENQRLAA